MSKQEVSLFFLQLQTPASFAQSVQELTIALQRTGDPANLNRLRPHLDLLANIDPSPGKKGGAASEPYLVVLCAEGAPLISVSLMTAPIPDAPPPTWEQLEKGLVAVKTVVHGLVDFIQNHSKKGADPQQVSENISVFTGEAEALVWGGL